MRYQPTQSTAQEPTAHLNPKKKLPLSQSVAYGKILFFLVAFLLPIIKYFSAQG
jgi:hypothetical protein